MVLSLTTCLAKEKQARGNLQQVDSLIAYMLAETSADSLIKAALNPMFRGRDATKSIPNLQLLLTAATAGQNVRVQAIAHSLLGTNYRWMGSPVRALYHHQLAMQLGRQSAEPDILCIILNQAAHVYKERGDYPRALRLYYESLATARQGRILAGGSAPLMNLAQVYLLIGQLDSSLMYGQRAYEAGLKEAPDDLDYVYSTLGGAHSRMGHAALASSYLHMGIERAIIDNSARDICASYTALAEHCKRVGQADSARYYAGLALRAVLGTDAAYTSAAPARLLASLYLGANCDSALQYTQMAAAAADSLTNTNAGNQIQLMAAEEDLRRLEAVQAATEADQKRQQALQYAAIAFGIVVLGTLYVLLSRTFITNVKTIQYAGVAGVLIVFEFFNLLLHPWLERITHHSPILMLLCLVGLGALLLPLHHRIEHWALTTLVAKNKEIRLAQARRTLQQLGD